MSLLLELMLFAIFFYLLYQYRQQWLFILSIFALGLVMEILGVHVAKAYDYHGFYVMPASVPLAIPAGWAIIIFSSVQIVKRSNLPELLYPFAVAFFTLIIDIALDPVMANAGVWVWKRGLKSLDFMGIPLYNFWGWFLAGFVVGISCMFLFNVKNASLTLYAIWGISYPILWFIIFSILRYVPYVILYQLLWFIVLITGILIRLYGFSRNVINVDILFMRLSFYIASLVVLFWSRLYITAPYVIVAVVTSLLIEIFVTSHLDVL